MQYNPYLQKINVGEFLRITSHMIQNFRESFEKNLYHFIHGCRSFNIWSAKK